MRAKLRRDTVFIETPDGVFFRNEFCTFNVKGKTTYRMFADMLPYLDGGNGIEEYLTSLSAPRKAKTIELMKALHARQVLLDCEAGDDEVPSELACAFRSQLEFFGHLVPDPGRTFQRFRKSRVYLLGNGEMAGDVAFGLIQNGLQTVVVAPGQSAVIDRCEPLLQQLAQDGVTSAVLSGNPSDSMPGKTCDLAVLIGDERSLSEIKHANAQAIREKWNFLPSFVLGDTTILGPLYQARQAGCWLCAMMRWANNAPPVDAERLWRALATEGSVQQGFAKMQYPLAGMLATSVVLEAVKYLAMPDYSEAVHSILIQDIETLEAVSQRFLPHPLCHACQTGCGGGRTERAVAEPINRPPKSTSEVLEAWTTTAGESFGLIQKFEHDNLAQLPLRRSALTISMRAYGGPEGIIDGCSTVSTEEAQLDALCTALTTYSALMTVTIPRVSATFTELLNDGRNPVSPSQLFGWLGNSGDCEGTKTAWVLVKDSFTGRPAHVPASAVDTSSGQEPRWFDDCDAGIGVGLTDTDAVRNAAMSLFAHRTLVDILHGGAVVKMLSVNQLAAVPADEVQFLVRTLDLIGLSPRMYLSVPSQKGVYVMLTTLDQKEDISVRDLRISAGLSLKEVIIGSLRSLLMEHQREANKPRNAGDKTHGMYTDLKLKLRDAKPYLGPFDFEEIDNLSTVMVEGETMLQLDITPPDVRSVGGVYICRVFFSKSI